MKEKRNKLIAIMALSMFLLSYMALTPIVANIYNSFPDSSLEEVQMIVTLIPLFSVVTMKDEYEDGRHYWACAD